MGIVPIGHRRRLLDAIVALQPESARRDAPISAPLVDPAGRAGASETAADRLSCTVSATDPSTGFVRDFTGTTRSSDASPRPRRLRLLDFPSWPAATVAAVGE